ncbi:major facilitator transporter [Candidatus Magnetobacterium bavaricum]|uniref:Major facilitator transporter n=1 Tax=Candidatus Magnetobacterium bavaricum TaxID=29290 RepID=A0A0F3GZ30_9BACT|nr:major facilitator transporter [Candidatus Magnetobacterium bavaricum]
MKDLEGVRLSRGILSVPVIVAALGYFVDIYDLILFGIVRVQSLKAIGVQSADIMDTGIFLLDMQMAGMLLGGFLWGVLGDKKGRVKILFGSIIVYSVANIANGFVDSVGGYAFWRFVAGIGLAGELGAGVTLVLETLPRQLRGYGTMIVATVGVSGAILGNYIAKTFDWRVAYFIGGGLGMALLIMRIGVYESGMYKQIEASNISKGNILMLFNNKQRFFKYIKAILIGLPIWFCVGILIILSPEFARAMNVVGTVSAGDAVMSCYIGLVLGDLASGVLSQYLRSRKKVVLLFLGLSTIAVTGYFMLGGVSSQVFYTFCGFIGFAVGYWAVFITTAAEQFGTNIRATVASTVPNVVRGMVIPITAAFQFATQYTGILSAGALVGVLCLSIAFYANYHLEETFDKDLDYVEL